MECPAFGKRFPSSATRALPEPPSPTHPLLLLRRSCASASNTSHHAESVLSRIRTWALPQLLSPTPPLLLGSRSWISPRITLTACFPESASPCLPRKPRLREIVLASVQQSSSSCRLAFPSCPGAKGFLSLQSCTDGIPVWSSGILSCLPAPHLLVPLPQSKEMCE